MLWEKQEMERRKYFKIKKKLRRREKGLERK